MRRASGKDVMEIVSVWTLPWYVLGKSFASAWSFYMLSKVYGDPILDHAFLGGAIVTWATLLVLARKFQTMIGKPLFPVGAFLCMVVGIGIVGIPIAGVYEVAWWVILLGLVIGGAGFALIFNLWFEFYGRLEPVRVTFYLCLDIIVVEVVWWFCCQLTNIGLYAAMILCAMLATVSAWQCCKSLHMAETLSIINDQTTYPWKLYAALFMYLFMSTACKSMLDYDGGFLTLGYLITAGIVLAYLFMSKRFKMANFYRLAMPVLTAALFSIVIFDTSQAIGWMLANTAYSLMLMFSRVQTCYLSYRYGYNVCKLFSLFNIVTYMANIAGESLASAVLSDEMSNLAAVIAGAVIVVIVWTLLFLNDGASKEKRLNEVALSDVEKHTKNDIYERLSSKYALTPRELAAVKLLLEGQTVSGIASELYIARSTVKVHLRNTYKKMNVHSREELTALINAEFINYP